MTNKRIRRSDLNILVVGEGPSAISVAANLLPKTDLMAGVRFKVTMIDKLPRAVGGGPFGPGPRIHRCNQRSQTMGLSPNHPRAFRDWLENRANANDFENEDLTHPPRQEFGIFLSDMLRKTRKEYAERGHKLESLVAEIINVDEGPDSVVATTLEGEKLEFDSVVLTNGPSSSDQYTELLESDNYFPSPYPTHALASKIPHEASVAIIGSSLTAIDAANGLAEQGHRGRITLYSRTGRIPAVQAKGERYTPAVFTPESTKKLLEMEPLPLTALLPKLREELEVATSFSSFDFDWMQKDNESAVTFLRRTYHCSQLAQPYQSVLRELYATYGEQIYRKLSTADKKFVKSSSLWKRFRHTMARPTAKAFLNLLESGQVSVIRGLKSIEPAYKSFRVCCLDEQQTTRIDEVDVVINATGASSNVPKLIEKGLADPLICSLVEKGQVTPHPVGGIDAVYDRWNVIRSNGVASKRIYATGHLVSGTVFYVSGMDAIARLTDQLAQALIDDWLAILRAIPGD